MLDNGVFFASLLICMSLGGYYKKIDDKEMKRNYGAGLGLLVACLVYGNQIYNSLILVWGNIIIIKCCDKKYVHQMSLAFTWTFLLFLHLNTKCSIYAIWMHQTIALRLVGLAFEVHLASQDLKSIVKSSMSKLSADKLNILGSDGLTTEPTAVSILTYSYFFIGLHRGPYFRFKIFEDHFIAPFGVLGNCRVITEHKLKKAAVCCVGYLMLNSKYDVDAYYDDEFYKSFGSEFRYLYSLPQMLMFFLYYQMVMMLCTGVCTETGFGVFPAKCMPIPGHGPTAGSSLLKIASTTTDVALQQEYNFSMLKCCNNEKILFGPKMSDTLRGWDMATRYWFSTYLYKYLLKGTKEFRSACTFVAWCVWLGPTLQHVILCATLWVYIQLEAEYTEVYDTSGSLKFPWNLGFSIMRIFCLLYLTPCFVVQDTETVLRYYNSIYWIFHFLLLILLILVAGVQKIKSSENQVLQSQNTEVPES